MQERYLLDGGKNVGRRKNVAKIKKNVFAEWHTPTTKPTGYLSQWVTTNWRVWWDSNRHVARMRLCTYAWISAVLCCEDV